MWYKKERLIIDEVKNYLSAYDTDRSIIPYKIVEAPFVLGETPCAVCDPAEKTIWVYKMSDVILSHELTHMVDSIYNPEWFGDFFSRNIAWRIERCLKTWRSKEVCRDWEKMKEDTHEAFTFLALYVFDGTEVRANVVSQLITGSPSLFFQVVQKAEGFVLATAKDVSPKFMPEYTKEEFVRRYYAIKDFVDNPTLMEGAKLMSAIRKNAVFQKYSI